MYLSTQSVHQSPEDVEYPGRRLQPGNIRLIRLVPGDWTDPIRCESLESNLLSAEYQALSYVWGAKYAKRFILLDNKMFPVNRQSGEHTETFTRAVEGRLPRGNTLG
jgi:hypothetical protein